MTAVEIGVVVAIVLVLMSVLSFGVYNIYQDGNRPVADLTLEESGDAEFAYTITPSTLVYSHGSSWASDNAALPLVRGEDARVLDGASVLDGFKRTVGKSGGQ